jgi:hypothetical protein
MPEYHSEKHVYIPVSRTGKRITLMACIAADGSVLTPGVIIPRKTVNRDLLLIGLTSEKVTIRSQPHGFVESRLFLSWLETTSLPELILRRITYNYHGPPVLFLDNCSAHTGDKFRELCEANRIILCFFPPHSSNQLQPLDLCLFGVLKRLLSSANKLDAVNIQTKHIASVVCAFLAAAVPVNVVKSFRLSGICLIADEGVLLCTIQPDRAKRLLVPLPSLLGEISDPTSDESDEEELRVFVEECTPLVYDGVSDDEE